MALPRSTIDDSGQVVIPLEIRRLLGLEPKDLIEFEVTDGRVTLIPLRPSILDYFMTVPALDRPMSDADLEEAFEQGVADDIVASMRRETTPGR